MNNVIKIMSSVSMGAILLSSSASAADRTVLGKTWDAKERFMIRARAIGVVPDEDSKTTIGGRATVKDSVVPELDFTYFFTDHIGAELIAGVTPHKVGAVNTSLGNLDLGEVWLLPPTLTVQYHFNPYGDIRPYAGAGLGYIHNFNTDSAGFNSIKYKDGVGYALQVGMDIAVSEHWALNIDVKKIYHDTQANINAGAVTADVRLDPWIFGVGIAYRF